MDNLTVRHPALTLPSPTRSIGFRLAGLSILSALVISGCGGDSGGSSAPSSAPPSAASEVAPPPPPAPRAPLTQAWDVGAIFTAAQASAGEQVYKDNCLLCHGLDAFTEDAFRRNWSGKTVGELYAWVSSSMPQNAPATLEFDEYAQVLSFIFQENLLPAGETPLGTDVQQLREIRLVPYTGS